MSLAPGVVVGGDFEVVGPLSSGGMGAVYVVMQKSVGRRRALKVMHQELLANAKLRDRFVQEAKIGATIDSEHVVEVIAAGIDEKLKMPWLAMELLEGKDLSSLIDSLGQLPIADVREVMDQLCHALAAAHEKGVVHRDLKPENVFVARTRRRGSPFVVKVLDFGIAKVIAEARATSAATAALGTPTFMAPEQTETSSKVTPAADVWALGLIVFRALTGKHYWNAANKDGASITALIRELVIDPIIPASERALALGVAERLPDGFDPWFASCVAREPEARFANAGKAQKELISVRGFDVAGTTSLHEHLGPERASAVDLPATKPTATVAAEPIAEEPDESPPNATIAAAPISDEPKKPPPNATIAAAPISDEPKKPPPNATVAAAPISDEPKKPPPNATIAAAPISDEPKRPVPNATVAAEPLREPPREVKTEVPREVKPIAETPLELERSDVAPGRSKLGLVLGGLGVVGISAMVYVLSGNKGVETPVDKPVASTSVPKPPASSGALPPNSAPGNRWIAVNPPSTPVLLGVPDAAPSARRGLRAAQRMMSPREPYAIQAREVSWAELDPFLKAAPALTFERPAGVPTDASARAALPAVGVPWEVATLYCEGFARGSLPTEAQWEFAARGGELRSLPWGSGSGTVELSEVRAFLGSSGSVAPVAGTPRDVTPDGIHDLMGNAREWTSSLWDEDAPGGDDSWVRDGETTARAVRGWPLRAERPIQVLGDGVVLDAAYREWVCATGACSPLHPGLSTKPPLTSIGLVIDAAPSSSAGQSALRAWVNSVPFSELLGRCSVATPLAANARVTLQADAKGCSQASLAPRDGVVFASFGMDDFGELSPYVYAQPKKAPSTVDRDQDGIPDDNDICEDAPEDKDGFQDGDGCPEPDNDKDGIADVNDLCPMSAETYNGYKDEDGCPDEKVLELMTPTPKPATPPAATNPTCKPSRAVLSSKDLPPRFLQCLEAGAPQSLTSTTAWKDEVSFKLKTVNVPPVLAEIGFRCVIPKPRP